MIRYVLGALILAMCSSCSSVYQYNVLSSDMTGTAYEPFTIENDSLELRYSFDDGNVNIEIFNKAAKPLYVDWSRSALVVNGQPEPYYADSPVSFIPPNSGVRNISFNLLSKYWFPKLGNKAGARKQFTPGSSPLRFKSYLLLSFDYDFEDPLSFDHEFWLSEIFQTDKPMDGLPMQNVYSTFGELSKGQAATVAGLGLFVLYFVTAISVSQ